jgi:transposase
VGGNGPQQQKTRDSNLRRSRVSEVLADSQCRSRDSTSYYKPIYNVLEERFELLFVNAQHLKAVPGCETDVEDAEWIADLLRHGLLNPSFVPDREQRKLRELVSYRTSPVAR